jgi:hypothetical protein
MLESQGTPSIRVNWSKLALKWLRQLPDGEREAVRARIGAETLSRIGSAGVFEWLPANVHMAIVDAVRATLGDRGSRRYWRELMVASFDRSLLKPLVDGGLRLFGRSPSAILRLTPQAYQLVSGLAQLNGLSGRELRGGVAFYPGSGGKRRQWLGGTLLTTCGSKKSRRTKRVGARHGRASWLLGKPWPANGDARSARHGAMGGSSGPWPRRAGRW